MFMLWAGSTPSRRVKLLLNRNIYLLRVFSMPQSRSPASSEISYGAELKVLAGERMTRFKD